MKKFLTILAHRFRRFATKSLDEDTNSVPSTRISELGVFEPPVKAGAAPIDIASSNIPHRQGRLQTAQPNETRIANSFGNDFITRQELSRELELLRRLIESRK